MPTLNTQKNFRKIRELNFCYFCGESFNTNIEKTRDHIPPESIFLIQDRTPPLILYAHKKCNCEQSYADNEIGQLISILHDKIPAKKNKILQMSLYKNDEGKISSLIKLDLEGIIFRWIRGFHAALYHEFLPLLTLRVVHTILNPAIIENGTIIGMPIHEAQRFFVYVIKHNRLTGNIDRILCNNEKCRYECVWIQATDGRWWCVFALKVYDWEQLGDGDNFPSRGCVGCYCPDSGVPENASKGIEKEYVFKNQDELDPFGE